MHHTAAAEHLKRQGAAAERQGVLEMLGRLRKRYEEQRSVFASSGRRMWYGRRIEFLDELMAMVRDRGACGTAAGDEDDHHGEPNPVVQAMEDFDRRVRDIMADSSVADTVAICAGCDAILALGDGGICHRCLSSAGSQPERGGVAHRRAGG